MASLTVARSFSPEQDLFGSIPMPNTTSTTGTFGTTGTFDNASNHFPDPDPGCGPALVPDNPLSAQVLLQPFKPTFTAGAPSLLTSNGFGLLLPVTTTNNNNNNINNKRNNNNNSKGLFDDVDQQEEEERAAEEARMQEEELKQMEDEQQRRQCDLAQQQQQQLLQLQLQQQQQQQQPPTRGGYGVQSVQFNPPSPHAPHVYAPAPSETLPTPDNGFYRTHHPLPQTQTQPNNITHSHANTNTNANSNTYFYSQSGGAVQTHVVSRIPPAPMPSITAGMHNSAQQTFPIMSITRPPPVEPIYGQVTVSDPLLIQPYSYSFLTIQQPYWTYQVQTNGKDGGCWLVRRRFRHVVTLEEKLRDECKGAILPPRSVYNMLFIPCQEEFPLC